MISLLESRAENSWHYLTDAGGLLLNGGKIHLLCTQHCFEGFLTSRV